jgi:hypothetical protein
MQKIVDKAKDSAKQVLGEIEKIKAQFQAQGQMLDETELRKHFLPQLESLLRRNEDDVCNDFDVAVEELEEGCTYYMEYGKIKEYCKMFTAIHSTFSGERIVDDSSSATRPSNSDISADDVIDMLNIICDADILQQFIENFLAAYGEPSSSSAVAHAFQQGMMNLSASLEAKACAKYNISSADFERKFGELKTNQRVAAAYESIIGKQEQLLRKYNLTM